MKTLVFTGGHHTSGLEVAKKLKKSGWHIVWLGHRHSMAHDKSDSAEYLDVTATGIEFIELISGKIYRRFSINSLVKLAYGFFQSFTILKNLQRQQELKGIVSFGGYLAVPVVVTGWFLGINSVTHEQTVSTGWANKVVGLFAKKIMLSWPQSIRFHPSRKTVLTGLPLRDELINFYTRSPKNKGSIRKIVYITGGKQGSHAINSAIFSALKDLVSKYKIIHQTGQSTQFNDHQLAVNFVSENYKTFPYDSKMGVESLLKADIVVSRSGAHTCYELALLQKPCVLIPLPHSSHSEQEKNADALVAAGQAIKLDQHKLDKKSLLYSIEKASNLKPHKNLTVSTDGVDNVISVINSTFK